MTRKEIDDIFQEYGQYATGKDYALVHAIAKTVAAQKCVCGEPNSSGTHRTDGPCLAPKPEQKPVAKVSKRYVNNIQWLNEVPEFDTLLYTTPPQPEQEPATKEQIREAMIFNLPLYTMPPHPDQEPVAWLGFNERGECREVFTRDMKKTLPNYPTEGMTPVYTTPPQRKPLTDEQIIASNYPDGEENGPTIAAPDFELICFARQIEAAHDIKE